MCLYMYNVHINRQIEIGRLYFGGVHTHTHHIRLMYQCYIHAHFTMRASIRMSHLHRINSVTGADAFTPLKHFESQCGSLLRRGIHLLNWNANACVRACVWVGVFVCVCAWTGDPLFVDLSAFREHVELVTTLLLWLLLVWWWLLLLLLLLMMMVLLVLLLFVLTISVSVSFAVNVSVSHICDAWMRTIDFSA